MEKIKITENKIEEERMRKRLEEINSQLLGEPVWIPELEYGIYLLVQEEVGRALKLQR